MVVNRRHVVQALLASGVLIGGQERVNAAVSAEAASAIAAKSLTLNNGFRAHLIANNSQYITATLILRSSEIRAADGLGHLLEHTSFVGAAGPYAASEIKRMHQDSLQESNASTGPGMIQWQAMFLPKYLEQALSLFALISLDQKCDVETVRQEARVVLQELDLDRYVARSGHQKLFDAALFGNLHPYGVDT